MQLWPVFKMWNVGFLLRKASSNSAALRRQVLMQSQCSAATLSQGAELQNTPKHPFSKQNHFSKVSRGLTNIKCLQPGFEQTYLCRIHSSSGPGLMWRRLRPIGTASYLRSVGISAFVEVLLPGGSSLGHRASVFSRQLCQCRGWAAFGKSFPSCCCPVFASSCW